jgi:hypothetical protein
MAADAHETVLPGFVNAFTIGTARVRRKAVRTALRDDRAQRAAIARNKGFT